MGSFRHAMWFLFSVAFSATAVPEAEAGPTSVLFDLPYTIECRDVTPEGFALQHPGAKVVEARIRISARVSDGDDDDLTEFLYMIESPERRLRVHDFLPNTRLDSHIAGGEIQVQQTESVDQGVHGNVGASANVLYNAVPITIGPSIGGNNNNKTTTTRKYSEVAPHELVLASGTTNREHGVYFKLKPTRENTLEGAKEFFALFVVPQQWRGDWARVTCVAKCRCKWCIGSDDRTCGTASRLVGLHLVDDGQARQIAQAIATVQDKQQKPSFLGLDRAFSKILPVSSRNDRAAERLPSLNELLDAMGELSANTSSVHRVQRALMPAD